MYWDMGVGPFYLVHPRTSRRRELQAIVYRPCCQRERDAGARRRCTRLTYRDLGGDASDG